MRRADGTDNEETTFCFPLWMIRFRLSESLLSVFAGGPQATQKGVEVEKYDGTATTVTEEAEVAGLGNQQRENKYPEWLCLWKEQWKTITRKVIHLLFLI